MLRRLFVPISVVENEFVVLDVLGDAIHLQFRLVHLDIGVEAADRVDFAVQGLLLEQGALPDTDANIHRGRTQMVDGASYLLPLLVDHQIEVVVADFTSGSGTVLALRLLLFELLHLFSALGPLLFHLLDVVDDGGRLR